MLVLVRVAERLPYTTVKELSISFAGAAVISASSRLPVAKALPNLPSSHCPGGPTAERVAVRD